MQAVVRGIALWLLLLAYQGAAMAVDAGRCAATPSDEQARYLNACFARGAQCTDYWPGYPEDLNDCARLQKWLAKAMTMPQTMRHEIFGPMSGQATASGEAPAPSTEGGAPAWKNLPRSQDSAAPRAVAGAVAGATATDYAGASSNLDPEQAQAAGVAFWTGQLVQVAGIVAEAKRAPVSEPRSLALPASAGGSRHAAPGEANGQRAMATAGPALAVNSPGVTRSGVSGSQESQSQRRPYKANANACISLRGNQIVNTCSKMVWVTFCVTDPRQTKNFFDSSDAFKCPNGGLENISGHGANGLIWHGWVHYFACYGDDIGTMKTNFYGTEPRAAAPGTLQGSYTGTYHGLCGGAGADGRQEGGGSAFAK